MSGIMRDFPREVSHGIWPTLEVTLEDKRYQPLAQAEEHRQRLRQQERRGLLLIDTLEALIKGAILGGGGIVLLDSVVLNLPFWLPGWRWAFGIAGVALLIFLFGLRRMALFISLGLVAVATVEIIRNPSLLTLLLTFIGAGMALRGSIELLPTKIA